MFCYILFNILPWKIMFYTMLHWLSDLHMNCHLMKLVKFNLDFP